jgi:hypothetical protein
MAEYKESSLKTYEIIGTDKFIVNTKSVEEALRLADYFNMYVGAGDLREVDIRVPPMFTNCILGKEALGIK